ncbi:hypothetical protein GCK72_012154 [Caenorhabditis remanei]|uniref:Uncharacterized protein n=1 Tax=Caenorhabditis remanei TaxID=31234 RepID=A0A6A5GM50_CAERE|nr:hypothetical protein GCK72_012154 [Caenorhabditis remanei]KAF1755704.1 hypothetical protein GCK72_012154 [Caenorhabditis remanei]
MISSCGGDPFFRIFAEAPPPNVFISMDSPVLNMIPAGDVVRDSDDGVTDSGVISAIGETTSMSNEHFEANDDCSFSRFLLMNEPLKKSGRGLEGNGRSLYKKIEKF